MMMLYFTTSVLLLISTSVLNVEAKRLTDPLSLHFTLPQGSLFWIDQNYRLGDVITNQTTCTSTGTLQIMYSFVNEDKRFSIDLHTGKLTMRKDATFLSCSTSCNISLTIQCVGNTRQRDEKGNPVTVSDEIGITVAYRLVNQYAPKFVESSLNISVPKNLYRESSHMITNVSATDLDPGECGTIEYSIRSGNDGGHFQLDPLTGVLTLISPLNSEQSSQFHLAIQAGNTRCTPMLSTTIIVNIKLIEGLYSTVSVNDLLLVGTLMASSIPGSNALAFINTSDSELFSKERQFVFTFASLNEFVTGYFTLNNITGELTLTKSLKYKYCLEPTFLRNLRISISICGSQENGCPIFDINLIVSDSGNDCSTSFTENKYTVTVNESAHVGTEIYNFTCRSPGRLETSAYKSFSLIHCTTQGVFFFRENTLILNESLDYESETEYICTIVCKDQILVEQSQATATVVIEVLPSNEYHPRFEQPLYMFTLGSIDGNQLPRVIGQVRADDSDSGSGGQVVYSLKHSRDSQLLEIGSSSGSLSLISNLDSYTCDKLVVVIEASDGLFTDQTTAVINLPILPGGLSAQPIRQCNTFCLVFIATAVLLVISLIIHIVTFITLIACYKKKQREAVVKFQERVLEPTKGHSECHDPSYYSDVDETVTVPCPMYSSMPSIAKTSNGHHHYTSGRRLGMELPPIPSAQAYERPLRKSSGKSDIEEYLEMSSFRKRERCNSDPSLSRKCSRDEAESGLLGTRKMVPILLLEDEKSGQQKKLSLLGDGEISPERRSVDNIYDFIVS